MAVKKAKTDQNGAVSAQVARPRLHRLKVSNFRCIGPKPVEIELDDIVVLVGPNNSGKSSILRAYQVVMEQGSEEGKLSLEDFPDGKLNTDLPPTIELETVVFDKTAPGERWVRTDESTKEMFVREKWTWMEPGAPKKVGWDVAAGDWDTSGGPWGAPNVAQANRPKPHCVGSFKKPTEQADEVVALLSKAITDRVKDLSKNKAQQDGAPNEYEVLLASITQLRHKIANSAATAVELVRDGLTTMIGEVFPGYSVTFDARPEDDVEKALNLYKPAPSLKMGPADGFHTTLERQGSGACRTLIWVALRILTEHGSGNSSGAERPHLLLMDEPELCLHPDAVREARRVLYDLPKTGNWQVMITTHSPVFIDLTRDNTSIARVERDPDGNVHGTTVFRPKRARLDDDDRVELKLLNLCDPYVAEFFFGGRTILVEGDTEFTAFTHVLAEESDKYKNKNVHVVRARGKSCIVSLCKVLNQFEKGYAVLHDSDREKITDKKTKKERTNPAWTVNERILAVTQDGRKDGRVRLLASVPNFEEAFFGEEADGDKPYSALARLKKDTAAYKRIAELLDCLIDENAAVPPGAIAWSSIAELQKSLATADGPGVASMSELA